MSYHPQQQPQVAVVTLDMFMVMYRRQSEDFQRQLKQLEEKLDEERETARAKEAFLMDYIIRLQSEVSVETSKLNVKCTKLEKKVFGN